MKKHANITIERIQNYLNSDQFLDVNLQSFLVEQSDSDAVKLSIYHVPDLKRIPFAEATKGEYSPTSVGVELGPTWSTHWFKAEITIPDKMQGKTVTLLFDPGCEALIWSKEGEPLMGITGGWGGDRHVDFELTKSATKGQKFSFYIEVAANGMFGAGDGNQIKAPNPNKTFTLAKAELVVFNELAYSIYWDLEVMLGIVREMPEDSQIRYDTLYCANEIINTILPGKEETLHAAKKIGQDYFTSRQKQGFELHSICATGNCHIDTAWLWPYDETKRKVARSWATQCRYIEQFPEYIFATSQMQQFEWLEQLYPPLFQKVKKLVDEKKFIPIGGTWVEMDCNIPSGEAFCRQFLYGQNYMLEKFGFKSSVFWLPDTFGYSSQLPQIVKSAGLEYFFTQKLCWNNINKFPHTSFYWKGLDGTSVLTHFSPADTYTAQASVKDVVFMVKNNKDKQYSNKSLLLYGNGDGGGGPLRPMIERIKRYGNLEGMPATVKFGNPETFYKQLEETSRDLNTWQGELYFELHRGTYTSQAHTKKYNRSGELLLRSVEMLWTWCLATKLATNYPKEELDRLWKLLLLNQFHDVLPGSSIGLVYVDAIKFFEDIMESGKKLIDQAKSLMIANSNSDTITVFNPTSWNRSAKVMEFPVNAFPKYAQLSKDGKSGLLLVPNLPAMGFSEVNANQVEFQQVSVAVEKLQKQIVVDNGILKVTFDEHGRIVQIFDYENQRNVIRSNELANQFKFYEDIPLFWDAWDVEIYHLEKGWDALLGQVEVLENGPLRVVLSVSHPISSASTLVQKIIISASSRLIEFENEVDWHENRKILKLQFPVNISCDTATFETQFGVLQRPTHQNSSWDMAKFEVCAHKFVDLSEFGYGVALLNDSKYGFSVQGNVISMSILRAPKAPDNQCDIGKHSFRYGFYPHFGTFAESDVVQQGYEFNIAPILLYGQPKQSANDFLFTCSQPNVVIDTIKRSEKDGNIFVIRLFESYGGRGKATIISGLKLQNLYHSNVLEVKGTEIPLLDNNRFDVEYTPFKMITILVKFDN